MKRDWKDIREVILFFAGLAGVAHETIQYGTERPSFLVLFAGMMGLPLYLAKDKEANR